MSAHPPEVYDSGAPDVTGRHSVSAVIGVSKGGRRETVSVVCRVPDVSRTKDRVRGIPVIVVPGICPVVGAVEQA
jgi:hypothetical protein